MRTSFLSRNAAWAEKMSVPIEIVMVLDEQRSMGELGYTIPLYMLIVRSISLSKSDYLVPDKILKYIHFFDFVNSAPSC